MSNTTIGPGAGAKKETVYSGPSPEPKQATASKGPSAPAGGTVYGGLTPGTNGGSVYGGPVAGGTVYKGPGTNGSSGSVYNPQQSGRNPSLTGTDPAAAKGSNYFFAIAIFSALNTVLMLSGATTVLGSGVTTSKVAGQGAMTAILVVNVVIVGIFVLLGIAARSGSKAAFIIGMVIYGADTALLLLSGHPELHIVGFVVHGIFLFGLFNAFRQLQS
jgi:hypothetical protein